MQDVIDAWNEAERAREEWRRIEERYRETVRAAVSDGVVQARIAEALGRTREMVRRDAMPEDQRDALKQSRRRPRSRAKK